MTIPATGGCWLGLSVNSQTIAVNGPTSTYVRSGLGCAGSLAPAELIPCDTPRLGQAMRLHVTNLPTSSAILVTGFSDSVSPLGPLPLALAPFGMPGCSAFVSPDFAGVIVGSHGIAAASLLLPTSPGLLGLRFFQQALIPDPAANAAGFVASDAAVGVIGM